ncbi:MAG: hypothetical protein ACP5T0_04670 [Verrucomicrobiia bacterium]
MSIPLISPISSGAMSLSPFLPSEFSGLGGSDQSPYIYFGGARTFYFYEETFSVCFPIIFRSGTT